jgi:hypothetical protein
MVVRLLGACSAQAMLVLAQAADAGRTLDPKQRARLLIAITSLALLSVFLIALAWVALRLVRRYVDRSSQAVPARNQAAFRGDDWADRPLVSDTRPRQDKAGSG